MGMFPSSMGMTWTRRNLFGVGLTSEQVAGGPGVGLSGAAKRSGTMRGSHAVTRSKGSAGTFVCYKQLGTKDVDDNSTKRHRPERLEGSQEAEAKERLTTQPTNYRGLV